jgi:UDP-N-acetylmuramoyl-tripeptide--D-alanyl-D-alanine ligase
MSLLFKTADLAAASGGRPAGRLPEACIRRVVTDSRQAGPESLFVAIAGQRLDGHSFVAEALGRGAACALVCSAECCPDGPLRDRFIVVDDTIAALGRLAADHRRRCTGCFIAVTGSNGKTTTKTMIAHLLAGSRRGGSAPASFNNHIGVPLTLLSAEPGDDFLVAELGTSAAGEIARLSRLVQPNVAVITSVGLAHLEGLHDLSGVVNEKLSLLDHLAEDGLAVVNIDEAVLREQLAGRRLRRCVTFGFHSRAELRATSVRSTGTSLTFTTHCGLEIALPVPGRHNASNALAAIAVGRHAGLPDDEIAQRLACCALPERRLHVRSFGDMLVIDDCYNANPTSMRAAIGVLCELQVPGRRVAIVGDMCELGASAARLHRSIGRLIATSGIDVLIGVGQQARTLCAEARRRRSGALELRSAASVEELQAWLADVLQPTDTVLLKGSRAMGLERLMERWPHAGPLKEGSPGCALSPL